MKNHIDVLAMAGLLLSLSNAVARADDYEVAYAIEIYGQTDHGKAECPYFYACDLPVKIPKIRASIAFDYRDHRHAYVHIQGQVGCCLFADGNRGLSVDAKQSGNRVYRWPIFEGRPRRGNEWVLNRKVGILYLGFKNLR